MTKIVVAAAAALIVGAAGGVLFLQMQLDPQLAELESQSSAAKAELRRSEALRSDMEGELDVLRGDLYTAENERAELMARLRGLETDAPAFESAEVSEDSFDAFAEAWDDAAPADENEGETERRRDRQERWGTDAEREQAYAERREQMRAFQEEMDARFYEQIAALGPEFADHYATIVDNRAYMGELREKMRDLETDEEREALFDEMREAGQNNQRLMDDVQRGLLADFAKTHGNGADQTGKYVQELRALLDSPAFRMEGMFAGGRGGPPGGFGGRGGFGGGRRGGR